MRVPQSPLYVGLFRTLGVLPATMSFAEVYPALQTKVVEGMDGPILGFYNAKMYEVTKFVAITYHMWDGFWLTLNPGVWTRMAKHQDIVTEELSAGADRMRDKIVKAEEKAQADLIARA